MSTAAYRPSQWGPTPSASIMETLADGTTKTYVFDGILQFEHESRLTKTRQPIQNGANLSDNAVLEPAVLQLDVMMSDAMASYDASNWTADASKSVSAFVTLLAIQARKNPLTVTTRLRLYSNMLITRIHAPDNFKTAHGLKAQVTLEETFVGVVSTKTVSARPDETASTNVGPVACHKPTAVMAAKNQKPAAKPNPSLGQTSGGDAFGQDMPTPQLPEPGALAPGAGNWSSVGLTTWGPIGAGH